MRTGRNSISDAERIKHRVHYNDATLFLKPGRY